jgi:transglutaminase-like putative cysteine protease
MTRIIRLPALVAMAMLLSCGNNHLIVDWSFRNDVTDDYRSRSEIYGSGRHDLFSLIDTIKGNSRREAVEFLLAYMPLSDLAVYDPAFLLANVELALRTRDEMAWGFDIPYDLFLHFVLPLRVNNENPDSFRLSYYDELKERVRGLSAMEAALEINRWCHEKVAYQPSDMRTSSPMATILSARGRCGEESTLTVSALRTAGVPARQVYTPRWAHSDDNHAWVEFWANGAWHYMGACEPELVPDRGWFTEPARRAMLVHTRAYGRYESTEPLVRREKLFSEINVLERYAITKELQVTVTDSTGKPAPAARVGYLIYNYAEFYPLAQLLTDNNGQCTLKTGIGSLLMWADDGKRFGFVLAEPYDTAINVTISSDHQTATIDLDLFAPPVLTPFKGIDEALVARNNIMLKREDSIRNSYINSWMRDISVSGLAGRTGISENRIDCILCKSMGNYKNIASFISGSDDSAHLAIRILENISDKDLRDTPASVLNDHLQNAPVNNSGLENSLYDAFVMSPRIDNEILTTFRSSLKEMPDSLMNLFASGPETIAGWIDTAITITETDNYYGTPVIPSGVEMLRTADRHSRDIFFVALCRTVGQAARLAPGTGRPQYYQSGQWHDVWFTGDARPSGEHSYLTFVSQQPDITPEYHIHFTLATFVNGQYKTLDYGYGTRINDLQERVPLYPGKYLLTTGNRDNNGDVLAELSFFQLSPGGDANINVYLRQKNEKSVAGEKIDLNNTLTTYNEGKIDLRPISGKGMVFIWIEPGKEPTRHLLNDLPAHRKEFDEWGGYFIFLTDPATTPAYFKPDAITGLPGNTLFASDEGLVFMKSSLAKEAGDHALPVVVCCDSDGNILFVSEGYRIGTGEQLLKDIR